MQEIIINKDKTGKKIIALLENGILLEKYEEIDNTNRLEGNIYLGKVQNVLQGMQAAFVNIGENKNTFLHIKDILPKIDTKQGKQENEKLNIKNIIKPGMPILIQVKRDASQKKGGKVSTHISLSGRFIVLMPNINFITISQKIEDVEEKERLLKLIKELLPKNAGAIIRTSAENKTDEEIKQDVKNLLEKWKTIQTEAKKQESNVPVMLYKETGIEEKLFLDLIDKKAFKITTNNKQDYQISKEIISKLKPKKDIQIELVEQNSILDKYSLETQIEKLESRKIWLKCGGFIIIDKTEALTAIDVNSGKYTGKEDLEETIFTVNKEATVEIAKQLRLRDIGGIIIIDYINMKNKENKEEIQKQLVENLKNDRSKTQVLGFTNLNLLEMTRKHMYGK